jgi:hypothetical protein
LIFGVSTDSPGFQPLHLIEWLRWLVVIVVMYAATLMVSRRE